MLEVNRQLFNHENKNNLSWDVVQMVEQSLSIQEVWGAIPHISITFHYLSKKKHNLQRSKTKKKRISRN